MYRDGSRGASLEGVLVPVLMLVKMKVSDCDVGEDEDVPTIGKKIGGLGGSGLRKNR